MKLRWGKEKVKGLSNPVKKAEGGYIREIPILLKTHQETGTTISKSRLEEIKKKSEETNDWAWWGLFVVVIIMGVVFILKILGKI